MSNSPYKNRSNLLKGIGTLCVFIIFGYYAYQDSINRKMLERSLNENASPPQRDFSYESSRLQRPSGAHGNAVYKDVAAKMQNAESVELNDCNTFNEHLDEYLEDPEDEITYLPEIYDALIDDEEEELITKEIDY